MNAVNIGKIFGLKTKYFIQNFLKSILEISFSKKINKKNTIIALFIVFISLITLFCFKVYNNHKIKQQIIEYYYVQDRLSNAMSMNLQDIKEQFLKPFSGIMRANNSFIVANILYKSDTKYKDAIEVLKFSKSFSNQNYINDVIDMNILAIQILHNEGVKNINNVQKIANNKKNRFNIVAQELLLESTLSEGKFDEYYKNIMKIYSLNMINKSYTQERFEELNYIASDFID